MGGDGVDRVLVSGRVTQRAVAATAAGDLRELRLDVQAGSAWLNWSVLLSTAEADGEAGELAEGEAVAFAGLANAPRFPGDPLARRLTADRALALRNVVAAPLLCGDKAAAPFSAREAFSALLDQVERLALTVGASAERARIATIMGSPDAAGRLGLAWEVAKSGLDVEAALAALTISKLASALPPVDPGASRSH